MHQIGNDFFVGEIDPDNGGRLLSLHGKTAAGPVPIVVPPVKGALSGQKATAFPLIPFGGRLRHGRFEWNGAPVQVPCQSSGHALHGDGADRRWLLCGHDPTSVTMMLRYPSPMWPFPAHVTLRYVVRGPVFTALFRVTNLSDAVIPFGLGWHPYFAVPSGGRLRMATRGCTRLDGEGFATDPPGGDGDRTFAPADGAGTWHCRYNGGPAFLDTPAGPALELRFGSATSHVVVHVPRALSTMAVEPLTHPLHHPEHSTVQPGKSKSMAVALRIPS